MTKKEVTQLSYEITGLAIKVHKLLGPGLLESVYEKCLIWELQNNGYKVLQQQIVPIKYGNVIIEADLRLDIMVNDTVIIEIKAVEKLNPVFEAQLLTYMKLLEKPQGLLFNFHSENLTKSMIPMVNEFFKRLPE
jgi:GxxExxY protein